MPCDLYASDSKKHKKDKRERLRKSRQKNRRNKAKRSKPSRSHVTKLSKSRPEMDNELEKSCAEQNPTSRQTGSKLADSTDSANASIN